MKDVAKYLISFRTQVQDIPLISNGYASAGRTKEHTRLMKPDDCVDFVMAMSAVQIVEKADILPKELFDI
jgi:hypothetical protein